MKIKSVQSIHLCKSLIQIIYNILKVHGGELKVNTTEVEGTEFKIVLPYSAKQ